MLNFLFGSFLNSNREVDQVPDSSKVADDIVNLEPISNNINETSKKLIVKKSTREYKLKSWKIFKYSNEGREYFYPSNNDNSNDDNYVKNRLGLRKKGIFRLQGRTEEKFCCAKVDSHKCKYELKLVSYDNIEWVIRESDVAHSCSVSFRERKVEQIEEAIRKGYTGPKSIQSTIRRCLENHPIKEELQYIIPSVKEVKNYKAYNLAKVTKLFIDQIDKFAVENTATSDPDQPYVLKYCTNFKNGIKVEASGTFNIIITTKRLLHFCPDDSLMQIDDTYRCTIRW